MAMRQLQRFLRGLHLWSNQSGQAYTEYGVILALIAITVIGALTILGQQVFQMWHQISTSMPH